MKLSVRFVGLGLLLATLLWPMSVVQAALGGLDSGTYYTIVYETGATQSQTIKSVKVVDLVKIGSREFVVIEPQGLSGAIRGYVALEHVCSILPVQYFQ